MKETHKMKHLMEHLKKKEDKKIISHHAQAMALEEFTGFIT